MFFELEAVCLNIGFWFPDFSVGFPGLGGSACQYQGRTFSLRRQEESLRQSAAVGAQQSEEIGIGSHNL